MKRFQVIFAALLLAEAAACVAFVASRPAIDGAGWQFLEQQRPKVNADGGTDFMLVADGLNFAVFRRPLGGWETAYGHLFQIVNVVPCIASLTAFNALQAVPLVSSKANSDLATAVFCGVAALQFARLAKLLSRTKAKPQVAAV